MFLGFNRFQVCTTVQLLNCRAIECNICKWAKLVKKLRLLGVDFIIVRKKNFYGPSIIVRGCSAVRIQSVCTITQILNDTRVQTHTVNSESTVTILNEVRDETLSVTVTELATLQQSTICAFILELY